MVDSLDLTNDKEMEPWHWINDAVALIAFIICAAFVGRRGIKGISAWNVLLPLYWSCRVLCWAYYNALHSQNYSDSGIGLTSQTDISIGLAILD